MRFSIIMCTYNSAETMRYAIESVRRQIYIDWEMIILDNGSKDESAEVIRQYEMADERIKGIYRNDNVGWPMGISVCLQQAKGEYMMFLGADDLVADKWIFEEINQKIVAYQPDIVWTGFAGAIFENGTYRCYMQSCPADKVYHAEHKIEQIDEIMRTTYYNSVMHYVRIAFLKEHGINFFSPYYGDCMGMTEAMCRVNTMVAVNKVAYILTQNTSQSSSRTVFDYNFEQQWKSILDIHKKDETANLRYIAERILNNLGAMFENIVMGNQLCDCYMNGINKSMSERFLKAEEWLSADALGEMMYYAGKERYEDKLLSSVGVLYMASKGKDKQLEHICRCSLWLAGLCEILFYSDENGKVQWRIYFSAGESKKAVQIMQCKSNKHCIGAVLLLNDDVCYENSDDRRKIEAIFRTYMSGMKLKRPNV